ncbi:probable E3 ubiquitin-protein ligase RHY1A isoform X2 [Cucurbita maxima]|uniref:Probable E3 ubiquitin-protein ligase RHY1A isoform X2 n=1 Tax=Cucurbita maxima TaxID=3661 RepID=A0A6J1HSD8_CUCMA|nr:probable E3 ubiquitin-protein ligase RHY1A isoform X2 [Cucurbita maxima]
MAGMLPGVECARRRRFHQSITSSESASTAAKLGSTRRSSFCLYTSNRDFHLTSSSSQNEKLGQAAREAKERLDERLRTHRKPENSRTKSSSEEVRLKKENVKGKEETTTKKRFSWGKLMKWKASEQEECTVCLERFRAAEPLVHLPCAHKFHSMCLVPWLQANAHCPCCRYPILAQ